MDSLKQELRQILLEVASLPENFADTADFYSDLGMPSMKAMELLMALEDRYGVTVPDEEFTEAVTLEQLTTMMQGLVH